jgi:hypothetical protein
MGFDYSALRMLITPRLKISKGSSWYQGKRFGFQTYVWDKPWKLPEIAVGTCSHGERVALWVEAGKRSGVLLAPLKTDPTKHRYYKIGR